MKFIAAIGGGIVGAVALTFIHETTRRIDPKAPRMDLLGMEAIAKLLKKAGADVPPKDKLFNITMAGDVLSNSLYYSLAGIGKAGNAIEKGAALGLAAGIGAVYLPKPLGLHKELSNRTYQTKIMTVSLYLAGGAISGFAAKLIDEASSK